MHKFQIWYQSNTQFINDKIAKLQKKALRCIISFADFREPSSPLFKKWKILKISDIDKMQNCFLVNEFLKGKLPESF